MELLTVVILTYNEEENIAACIESLTGAASRVIVLDNLSTDRTAQIAGALGAQVVESEKHVRDRIEWVLGSGLIESRWVCFFDADERMTPESVAELIELCARYADDGEVNGIVVRYRQSFLGRELRHGGFSPMKKLRVFKSGTARYERMEVDEHFVLTSGGMVYMKRHFLHLDFKGLAPWVDKHTVYAERAARDFENKLSGREAIGLEGLERGARRKRWLKYRVYYRLPAGLRAWLFYIYCYYLRLGFLDGREGHMYAFLHSYWYRFLVDTFIYERQLARRRGETPDDSSDGRDKQ